MELVPTAPDPEFKARLRETYDAHAEERDRAGEADWRWPLCQQTISILKSENKNRLLEIGAGPGHTAKYFADRGLDVVAVDLSAAHVERARAKGLTAYHRDFYDLGFRMESFDAVWAMNCLLHVPTRDLREVLEGLRDVLVDGGVFWMGAWGGIAREGIYEQDAYRPPRFFALRTDDELLAQVEEVFIIEDFTKVEPPDRSDERLHVQFVRARKR
jgi:SAM-dependent methyltransferase